MVNGTLGAEWGRRGAAELRKWEIGMMTVRMTTRQRGFAIVWLSLAVALACSKAVPATAEDLYRAQTVVTGQGEANRMIGFASCMENILIKVSGAQQLAGDRRLAAYKSKAKDFVSAYDYHDQFSGKPTRDEQGTRDRPYVLTVDFDKDKIDRVLRALGVKPWPSHRPVLAVVVQMEQGERKFFVTKDGARSDLQRDALLAAAAKWGMSMVLPKSDINGAELNAMPSSALALFVAEQGGEVALIGHLVWDEQELGWTTQWNIEHHGRLYRWQLRGVTFDEAFRRGIGGAAQVLSDNGEPGSRAQH